MTELEIACPRPVLEAGDAEHIAQAFHTSYHERYAVSEPDNDVEFVMWRLVASGMTEPVSHPPVAAGGGVARVGTTRFYDTLRKSMVEAPLIDPDRLAAGETLAGPALLVAVDTTIVLPSGARAAMAEHGYLTIELDD